MVACCSKAITQTGRLLRGPSGPAISSGNTLKEKLWFRSGEYLVNRHNLKLCLLISIFIYTEVLKLFYRIDGYTFNSY